MNELFKEILQVIKIMVTATIIGVIVLFATYIISITVKWLFPNPEWFAHAIGSISHVFTMGIFVISCVRDFVRFYKNKK